MKTICAALLAAGALSGCFQAHYFVKADGSEGIPRDLVACDFEANKAMAGARGRYSDLESYRESLVEQCMSLNGYVVKHEPVTSESYKRQLVR